MRSKLHQTLIQHEIKHTPRLTAPQKCASADALYVITRMRTLLSNKAHAWSRSAPCSALVYYTA